MKFTREEEAMAEDHVLGKKIPSIVFVKNQQFLKDVLSKESVDVETKKIEARHQCEVNLYMHYLLKAEGIQPNNIDNGIAISFCDMNKSVKNQLSLRERIPSVPF